MPVTLAATRQVESDRLRTSQVRVRIPAMVVMRVRWRRRMAPSGSSNSAGSRPLSAQVPERGRVDDRRHACDALCARPCSATWRRICSRMREKGANLERCATTPPNALRAASPPGIAIDLTSKRPSTRLLERDGRAASPPPNTGEVLRQLHDVRLRLRLRVQHPAPAKPPSAFSPTRRLERLTAHPRSPASNLDVHSIAPCGVSRDRALACWGFASARLAGCGDSDELDLKGALPTSTIPVCCLTTGLADARNGCQLVKLAITACVRGDDAGKLPASLRDDGGRVQRPRRFRRPAAPSRLQELVYVMLNTGRWRWPRAPKEEAAQSSFDRGRFLPLGEKDIVFINRGEPLRQTRRANATLVHEFVHLLQDRRWISKLRRSALRERRHLHRRQIHARGRGRADGRPRARGDARSRRRGSRLGNASRRDRGLLGRIGCSSSRALSSQRTRSCRTRSARATCTRAVDEGRAGVLDLFANPPTSSKALDARSRDGLGVLAVPRACSPTGIEHFSTSNLARSGCTPPPRSGIVLARKGPRARAHLAKRRARDLRRERDRVPDPRLVGGGVG